MKAAAEFGRAIGFVVVVFVLRFTVTSCKSGEHFLLLPFTRASVPLLPPVFPSTQKGESVREREKKKSKEERNQKAQDFIPVPQTFRNLWNVQLGVNSSKAAKNMDWQDLYTE